MKALVVEDDLALADVVSFTLRRAGFEVILAHDGQIALDRWKSESPDIIMLDLNLPKIDGFTVCKKIRDMEDTPIIILSVRNEDDDVIQGLKFGADDFIVKPFSPRQVIARIEAVLRRYHAQQITPEPIKSGDLTLDLSRKELHFGDDQSTQLTRLECRLLDILMRNTGQVIPTESLIDFVWGPAGGDRDMLKQLVYRLRRKIENNPTEPVYLETVAGIGYSMPASQNGDQYRSATQD